MSFYPTSNRGGTRLNAADEGFARLGIGTVVIFCNGKKFLLEKPELNE